MCRFQLLQCLVKAGLGGGVSFYEGFVGRSEKVWWGAVLASESSPPYQRLLWRPLYPRNQWQPQSREHLHRASHHSSSVHPRSELWSCWHFFLDRLFQVLLLNFLGTDGPAMLNVSSPQDGGDAAERHHPDTQ